MVDNLVIFFDEEDGDEGDEGDEDGEEEGGDEEVGDEELIVIFEVGNVLSDVE